LNSIDNIKLKRISIDLPEDLIKKFDTLRKKWGLRSRGSVVERLLNEVIKEKDLTNNIYQKEFDFEIIDNNFSENSLNENSSLVLIKKNIDGNDKNFVNKYDEIKNYNKCTPKVSLPKFASKNFHKHKKNVDKRKLINYSSIYKLSDIDDEYLSKCQSEIINYWLDLYGNKPNQFILESSIDWLNKEIWQNIDGTENVLFTWTAANNLMREIFPFWTIKEPSFEQVILLIGIFEDPYSCHDLVYRIPSLIRRFTSRFKKFNKTNSFNALDSTMTVIGALKLLDLSIEAGSSHTLLKIRNAYRKKAMNYHPDSGGSTNEMRKINEAYQLLKNLYRNKS